MMSGVNVSKDLAECLNETMVKKLEQMAEADIRTIDPAGLVDIKDVRIDQNLPQKERVLDYIRQVRNPYCYLDHGIIIKISFSKNGETLDSCMKKYLESELLHTGV